MIINNNSNTDRVEIINYIDRNSEDFWAKYYNFKPKRNIPEYFSFDFADLE